MQGGIMRGPTTPKPTPPQSQPLPVIPLRKPADPEDDEIRMSSWDDHCVPPAR
jgi:hypothetical protein